MNHHNEGMKIQKNSSANIDCPHVAKQLERAEKTNANASPFKEPESKSAAQPEYDDEKWKIFVKKLLNEIDRDNQEDLDRPTATFQEEKCGQTVLEQANILRTNLVPKDFPP